VKPKPGVLRVCGGGRAGITTPIKFREQGRAAIAARVVTVLIILRACEERQEMKMGLGLPLGRCLAKFVGGYGVVI